jgi:hypothetical protein
MRRLQDHLDQLNADAHPRMMEQVEPMLDVVRHLVRVHLDEQDDRWRNISEQSPAAKDDRWAAPFGGRIAQAPVMARDRASLQLYTAGSHLRATLDIYSAEWVNPYSPLVVLRACVEASAWAHWLCDTNASPRERVSRSMSAQLNDQWQIRDWGADEDRAKARRIMEEVLTAAEQANLSTYRPPGKKARRESPYVGTTRATSTGVMDKLLPADRDNADEIGGLGKATQWYLSLIVHSNGSGLHSMIDRSSIHPDASGHLVAALTVSAKTIVSMATLGGLAFMTAADTYRRHVGWASDDWQKARLQLGRHCKAVEPALRTED